MPTSLPYLPSNKNIETLFSKIQSAKIPDKFSHNYLQTTLGLKGPNNRALIPFLRTLGFIDPSGTPTAAYRLLKSQDSAKKAITQAMLIAYAPLFAADEKAHSYVGEKLKGLVAQVAGTDDYLTRRIVSTFSTLGKLADFSTQDPKIEQVEEDEANGEDKKAEGEEKTVTGRPLRPEFHYNIQVHLPSNATEESYLNIFNALRKAFQ